MRSLRAIALTGLTLLVACAPPEAVGDSVAVVRGAPVTLELISTPALEDEVDGWSDGEISAWLEGLGPVAVSSDDPSVFVLSAEDEWSPSVSGVALEAGVAALDFEDPWTGDGALSVSVFAPDRVELSAFDPYAAGPEGWVVQDAPPEVLLDGTLWLRARPFAGELALAGASVLEVEHGPGLLTEVSVVDGVDVLSVRPTQVGEHVISLFIAGEPVGRFTVVGVSERAVAALRLVPSGEAEEGAPIQQGIRVEDIAGEPIFGALPEWTVGGETAGRGDGIYYIFAGDAALPVEVRLGGLTVSAVLPATAADVYTSDAGGGALDPVSCLLVLGLGALTWLGRREDS